MQYFSKTKKPCTKHLSSAEPALCVKYIWVWQPCLCMSSFCMLQFLASYAFNLTACSETFSELLLLLARKLSVFTDAFESQLKT